MAQNQGNGRVVFIITAGNCGACINIKTRGLYQKMVDGFKSRGAQVYDVYVKSMSDEYTSQGTHNFKHMDAYINSIFKRNTWFPLFFCMSKDLFDDIEDGVMSSKVRIGAESKVFNGSFDQNSMRIMMVDQTKGISEPLILSWFDELASSKLYTREVQQPQPSQVQIQRGFSLPLPNTPPSVDTLSNKFRSPADIGQVKYGSNDIVCTGGGIKISSRYGK